MWCAHRLSILSSAIEFPNASLAIPGAAPIGFNRKRAGQGYPNHSRLNIGNLPMTRRGVANRLLSVQYYPDLSNSRTLPDGQ